MSGATTPDADLQRREFTLQARAMSDARTFHLEAAIEPFVRLLGVPLPSPVLDLACGPGIVSAALARAGARVIGVDLTPAMLERARQRCALEGLTGVELRTGEAERLPFADSELPAAVSRLSLHHFPDPPRVLCELRRVLGPGGRLVIGDIVGSAEPDEAALHDAIEILRDPSHQRLLPESELLGALADAGFRVDAVECWENPKTFDEWAAIVEDARSMAPVRVVVRELALAGRHAGIDLRVQDDTIRFVHHWRFVAAAAA